MFQVQLSELIIWQTFSAVSLIFLIWLVDEYLRRRFERKQRATFQDCAICGAFFENKKTEKEDDLLRCPYCQSLNERRFLKEL